MPLHIARLQRSKAWLMCKRDPQLAFYMMNLWMRSWHEVPAGSLENDDDVLADAAMCPPREWDKIKEKVLRGWMLQGDRLHHSVVQQIAAEAWERKQTQRQRTEKARQSKLQNSDGTTTKSVTGSVTASVTGSKGREGKGKRRESTSVLRTGGTPPTEVADEKPDIQTELYREAKAYLAQSAGKTGDQAGALVGKWLKDLGDDHAELLDVVRRARLERVAAPIPWIAAAVAARKATADGDASDPWGMAAWLARQPDVKPGRMSDGSTPPCINGTAVPISLQRVAEAAKLPETWRGELDPLGAWLRADISVTDRAVLDAIEDKARWMGANGRPIRSLDVFDAEVRAAARKSAA
jgi:uncharacterized protein YdaU (DUF1376 family)